MTKQEFEQHRLDWLREWNDTWRQFDIDFESYMLMKGITGDEYKRLNEMPDGEPSGDDCSVILN